MATPHGPLDAFHPLIRSWFSGRFGAPTEAQRLAWPAIAAGGHVLLSAATGSGKTLAAFLAALDRLVTGAWPAGCVRVLYVSPLKALGSDVRRNLLAPLDELRASFAAGGEAMPEIRVETRTGDTPAEERRRMTRRPPEILITTPETLNILLTSRRGRALLGGVAAVILDEVHAVVGSKRGVHLITAVERVARLAGEVQRIGLSATVRPLDRVARWLGGAEPAPGGPRPRRVAILAAAAAKEYELAVHFPGAGPAPGLEPGSAEELWKEVVGEVRRPLRRNRSTLVFANSRRMVEKLTRLVNDAEGEELVYSHHGSLAREVRTVVEERLKAGELRGIVATHSLELGIDIGSLDEVVLVQTPPSVASTVQRIGRAGHTVGETSRARFVPLAPRDLLDAAVITSAVREGAIEPITPVGGALDVLAQVIASAVATESWPVEELFALVRRTDPYRDLTRRQFDLVLDMLAGRYASVRIRALRPLVSIDRIDGTVRGRPGLDRLVYLSGGTIPDRGYYHLRREDGGSPLGELDEEFVWERSVGDTFTLGVQSWRIQRITHNDVMVTPTRGAAMAPFWRAERRERPFELAERVGRFLEGAEDRLADPGFRAELESAHALDRPASAALVDFLERQKAACGGRLPHRHLVVAEHVSDPQGRGEPGQLVIHTLWGGRVNLPLALALQSAWQREHGVSLEVSHDDDCLIVSGGDALSARELLALVPPDALLDLLRERLARSGLFGARFREAAGCALLLPREGFRRRTPLWLSRQRAKELLEAVSRFDDFPLVLEAWRSCLVDAFDLDALRGVLEEIRAGTIDVMEVRSDHPSPFAAGVLWLRTNELMYEDDTPTGRGARIRGDLLREVALAHQLRPRIPASVAETFRRKLQRSFPGYTPSSPAELVDWVVERGVIPVAEWRELLAAIARDHGVDPRAWLGQADARLAAVGPSQAVGPLFVVATQELPRVLAALGWARTALSLVGAALDGSPAASAAAALERLAVRPTTRLGEDAGDPLVELAAELLRFEGPVDEGLPARVLGLAPERALEVVEALADAGRIVVDEVTDAAVGAQLCDTDNLERLLRIVRARARSEMAPLPASALPLFLASWHGLGGRLEGIDGLRGALERLFGVPASAEAWETEILPARLDPYFPGWLDELLVSAGLLWVGCGEQRLLFTLAADRELFPTGAALRAAAGTEAAESSARLFPAGTGRFTLDELLASSGLTSAELTRRLWALAWGGRVSNDSLAALRRGLEGGFEPATAEPLRRAAAGRRLRFERWRGSRPFDGHWFPLPEPEGVGDSLDALELDKDRVRILLDRYGVLFREVLERELPALRWARLFRTLRLMELSGEVVTGQFFAGVAGVQFAAQPAVRFLREGLDEELVWWTSGADPITPCGLGVAGLPTGLPRRHPSNHVVFRGSRPVVVSERGGRRLAISVAPDHPALASYLMFLVVRLTRQVRPVKAVDVEAINGQPAASSPFREALAARFHVVREGTALRLMRRY
ncbi:MAG: DEAD/DEAH box helicase [Acidobacteriota bacterium]